MALVVHGKRGNREPKEKMRGFLLAGPFLSTPHPYTISYRQWQGIAVDSFLSRLAWGVSSTAIMGGKFTEILGLSSTNRESQDSFKKFLLDSIPSLVPEFRPQVCKRCFIIDSGIREPSSRIQEL